MILNVKTLQDNCKKILDAVDSSITMLVSELLELEVKNQSLYLNVTNKEYFVSVKLPIGIDDDFHACVDAKVFLNLISKITTPEIELTVSGNSLNIKANGNYKLPLIYDEAGNVISLPKIKIENETNSFNISGDILQSILKYNSKELLKDGCNKPAQKLFYIDESGALTYSNGACVNTFNLEHPITLFLSEKIIKLFKLFKGDVTLTIGQDLLTGTDKFVSKVSFINDDISLTAVLNIDQTIAGTFPVKAIRELASSSYDYVVNLDKNNLLSAINRLSLFSSKNGLSYTYLLFKHNNVTVFDTRKDNHEIINYSGSELTIDDDGYLAMFNTPDLKLTLETCDETHINLGFGNHRAVVISRGNVKNIIPECIQ